ncbi:MAG: spermidine/putrescine ABC transporter substrate-binding protein [Clostridiales bacterium]|nr:spermidine/putrescine ABC transporter substrate-binding protein [Clostridiales bacterium]
MKKKLALLLSACMMVMAFSGCGGGTGTSSAGASEAPTESGSGEGSYAGHTLYVANWQAYSSDTNYCEKAFEDKFGCNVEHVYFNSYDELMTTLQTGGTDTIDCVVLSQNYTQYFKDQDLIKNIDPARIPNYAEVSDVYRDVSPYAVDDEGNVFAFPWTSGVTSIAYNPDKVSKEIKHWSDLLDPEVKGHVCLFGDYGDGMIIASLISGQDPSDPENLDLDKVADTLAQLKPQILSFWGSNDEQLMPYYSGEFWVGDMWSGPYAQLLSEGYNVKYVHPEEGTVGYLDYWCVVNGTDEEDLACEWINWIESYELQYTMATGEGSDYKAPEGETYPTYSPVNQKALDGLTEEQLVVLGMDPMPTKICMLNYLTPEQKDAWMDTWETFKASVG